MSKENSKRLTKVSSLQPGDAYTVKDEQGNEVVWTVTDLPQPTENGLICLSVETPDREKRCLEVSGDTEVSTGHTCRRARRIRGKYKRRQRFAEKRLAEEKASDDCQVGK